MCKILCPEAVQFPEINDPSCDFPECRTLAEGLGECTYRDRMGKLRCRMRIPLGPNGTEPSAGTREMAWRARCVTEPSSSTAWEVRASVTRAITISEGLCQGRNPLNKYEVAFSWEKVNNVNNRK